MAPKTPAPEETLTIPYKEYMESQNEIVNVISQHYSVASGMMMASTRSMQAISTAMLRIRESTKAVVDKKGEGNTSLKKYPALEKLLKEDPAELYNPMSLVPGFAVSQANGATSGSKVKKPRKVRDPNAPKRPQTAFFLYMEANRDAMKKSLEGSKPGEVNSTLQANWHAMSEEEKEVFKVQYSASLEEYKNELDRYKAKGGKVVDEELPAADEDAADDDEEVEDAVAGKDDAEETDDDESEESNESDAELAKEPTPPPVKFTAANGKKSKTPAKKAESPEKAKIPEKAKVLEKAKSSEKKKTKEQDTADAKRAATAAKVIIPVVTPVENKKSKEDSPEASKKKKRKSTGPEAEEKKKKRKDDHGDDY